MGAYMLDDYVGLFWLLGIVGVTILIIVTICILKIASRESRREERELYGQTRVHKSYRV